MTVRRPGQALALLAAALLALAGCDAGRPAASPTAQATQPPPAETGDFAFPSFDLSSFDLGSFALPSFSSDPELEAMLPDELGGVAARKQSLTGSTFLGTGLAGAAALEALLDQLDKSPDDLSVGFGTTPLVTIIAYRIDGIPARQLFTGLELALAAAGSATITDVSVGSRSVKQVVTATETTYVYLAGDAVFVIGGTVTPPLLEEAVLKLPAS